MHVCLTNMAKGGLFKIHHVTHQQSAKKTKSKAFLRFRSRGTHFCSAISFWSRSVISAVTVSSRQSFGAIKRIIYEWMTAIPHLITLLQTAKCGSPTHCFDSVSFGWPQRPAHPRFPQHLQVIGIALHKQHVVLQPSLEGNFRHRFHESFIPEASQILRLKIRKYVLSVSVARAEFDVLVPAENNSERRGWQLDRAVLYRHFCLHMNLNLVLRMRHHNSVYLIQQLSLNVSHFWRAGRRPVCLDSACVLRCLRAPKATAAAD